MNNLLIGLLGGCLLSVIVVTMSDNEVTNNEIVDSMQYCVDNHSVLDKIKYSKYVICQGHEAKFIETLTLGESK